MSADEIVFDEVRYRDPVRLRRPDRDRSRACVAYEVPGADDLPIFLDRVAADAIERHALRDTSVELGGILLGKECVDEETGTPFVWVTRSVEAKHYENTQASFTYTHESWEEITRERDAHHPDLDIVGWYHTHPDFGIFLSHHDLFIQHNFFAQPLQVAYVVDPIRQTRGFFRWRGDAMEATGGFFLTAERNERLALARLANDLENIPDAHAEHGGGLGGLTPRLEAELIAMLSRPTPIQAHAAVSSIDRATLMLAFTMLGAVVGMVALSAVMWLNALNSHVADQTRALDELRKDVGETAARQRVALDAAGGASADELLRKLTRERDKAFSQLADQKTNAELLAERARTLGEKLTELQSKYDKTKRYEADAKEYQNLLNRYEDLRAKNDALSGNVIDLQTLLETPDGKKKAELALNYRRAWYLAATGWAVSVVLGLAFAGFYALQKFPPPDSETARDVPHSIS